MDRHAMDRVGDDDATVEAKQALRRTLRDRRKALSDRAARSAEIGRLLAALPAVQNASRIMAYSTMGSEVDTEPFVAWCAANGKVVAMPEDDVDPTWPDVIIVPGLAFTTDGARCGQGGGWYDRFLPGRRAECTTIGVGFDVQLVDTVPMGPFDVTLDVIIIA